MPATEAHRIAVIVPAMVGAGAVVCTIVIHAMALGGTVSFDFDRFSEKFQEIADSSAERSEFELPVPVLELPDDSSRWWFRNTSTSGGEGLSAQLQAKTFSYICSE